MNDKSHIKLIVVDDHEVVRIGLRSVFRNHPAIQVIADTGSVKEAIQLIKEHSPDVVLADVQMPEGGGVEVCKTIKATQPSINVLMLTSYADDDTVFDAISAGADGFLLKDVSPQELTDAIKQVSEGQSILDPAVTKRVMGRLQSGAPASVRAKMDSVSAQERRVMALVAEGKTNKEIALDLGLSDKTVKNYLANAMDKLQITRRSQAAVFYVNHLKDQ